MNLFAAASPLILVIFLSAVLRRPAFIAAWCGVMLVVLLMLLMPAFTIQPQQLASGLAAAGLITLQALFVIASGLYLNELLTTGKVHDLLVEWVNKIPMAASHKAILIVVGLAPALESLTGFGVSLLVTIPLLMAITTRQTALRQALLSMSIMPWGTLALATIVGSQIADQKVATLGLMTALISSSIFPVFGAVAAALVAEPDKRYSAVMHGILIGAVLSICLIVLNWAGLVELAGVLAGIITTTVCLLIFSKNRINMPPWGAVIPYGILLGLVLIIRILPQLGVPLNALSLKGGNVSFAPFTSPGIALVATIFILSRGKFSAKIFKTTILRIYKPVLALGGFTVMAQLMVVSGMIIAVGKTLPTTNICGLTILSPLLGIISGYLTGSNVGGNALMMTLQSTIGNGIGKALFFAALQNSSAGHAVFASMPIILLILAISGGAQKGEESALVRYGLLILGLIAIVTIATAMLLVISY